MYRQVAQERILVGQFLYTTNPDIINDLVRMMDYSCVSVFIFCVFRDLSYHHYLVLLYLKMANYINIKVMSYTL